MAITAGQPANASDFISTSAGAADVGKVAKLDAKGRIDKSFLQLQQLFGDGSDGAVTISANTTLTRDMYYTDLTINAGITLSTGGYKIFGTGTLTNNGTIANNGSNASTFNGGAGAASGSLGGGKNGGSGFQANANTYGGGGGGGGGIVWIAFAIIAVEGTIEAKGGNGANAATGGGLINQGPGTAGTTANPTMISSGSGGAGGNTNSGQTGGTGGTRVASTMSAKNISIMLLMIDTMLMLPLYGAPGGGGGASDQSSGQAAGGGGGQGGYIFEMYKTLTTSGTRTVTGGSVGTGIGSTAATAGSSGLTAQLVV